MKTQVELEMEPDTPDTDGGPIPEPIVTIEEEEAVVLFWDSGDKSKGIRELAMGAREKIREDVQVLDYYRCVLVPSFWTCCDFFMYSLMNRSKSGALSLKTERSPCYFSFVIHQSH